MTEQEITEQTVTEQAAHSVFGRVNFSGRVRRISSTFTEGSGVGASSSEVFLEYVGGEEAAQKQPRILTERLNKAYSGEMEEEEETFLKHVKEYHRHRLLDSEE